MARLASPLDTGAPFPQLQMDMSDGSRLDIPANSLGEYALVLIYRGKW